MRGFLSLFSRVSHSAVTFVPSFRVTEKVYACLFTQNQCQCWRIPVPSYAFHSMRIKRGIEKKGSKYFQQYHLCIICEGGETILATVVASSMKKAKMKAQTIEPGGSCVSIFCCFCDIFILYLQKQDLMPGTWRLKSQRQRWQERQAHFIYCNIALTSGPDHSLLSWDAISGINPVLTFNLSKSCQCPSCLLGISLVMYTLFKHCLHVVLTCLSVSFHVIRLLNLSVGFSAKI